IDNLEALLALPELGFLDLTGVVSSEEGQLADLIDHEGEDVSPVIETKDGTRFAVEKGHTLLLSAGSWAWKRLELGGAIDGDEIFTVSLIVDLVGGVERHRIRVSAKVDGVEVDASFYDVTALYSDGEYDLQLVFDGGHGDDQLI